MSTDLETYNLNNNAILTVGYTYDSLNQLKTEGNNNTENRPLCSLVPCVPLNSEGKIINKIDPMTSRGYKFTIDQNNELLISTGDYLYKKDLFGQLIEKKTISNLTGDLLSGFSRYKYTANDGTKYVMKMHFFRTNIYRMEGQVKISVYKMPLLDYFVRLLSYIVYGSMAVIIPIGTVKWKHGVTKKQG